MWIAVILLVVIASTAAGQPSCTAPAGALYSNIDLSSLTTCMQIDGDLILGDRACGTPCTITDLSSLNSLSRITGSFIIQCCNSLSIIPALTRLTSIDGTFKIHYNTGLTNINGLILATVGNIEISQNPNLQSISGFQYLNQITGYLSINYNPSLTSITGFTQLTSVLGGQLVNDQAITLLYNAALNDISGFRALSTIDYGTLHIEGNTNLCYAGYPKWTYGSYGRRYSTGDKGIDWRSKLSSTNSRQFTWGINGVPTLVIQNNGNLTTCASAVCHRSCTTGAGCIGPESANLCGRCYQTSNINSCDEVNAPGTDTPPCAILWPPTELPFSAIFGVLVGLGGILILIVIVSILAIVFVIHRRFNKNRGGDYTFNNAESGNNNNLQMSDNTYQYSPVRASTIDETRLNSKSNYEKKWREERDESSEEEESSEEVESDERISVPVEVTNNKDDELMELMFPSKNVQLLKEFGQGEFGKLHEALANDLIPNERVSRIVVKECRSRANEEELENFLQPAKEMRKLKHENVLQLLGVSVDGKNMMILLEYSQNGNLKSYLKKNKSRMSAMKEDGSLLRMIIDVASGLDYIHSMEVPHKDVAARNCLVFNDNRVKIGDYGNSKQTFRADYYTRTPGQTAWPIRWMAPEIIVDKSNGVLDSLPEDEKSNMWSFGILMWEVCTFCEQPYSDMTNQEVIEQVCVNEHCNLRNPVTAPDPLSPLFPIMKKCWKTVKDRSTLTEILPQLQDFNITHSSRPHSYLSTSDNSHKKTEETRPYSLAVVSDEKKSKRAKTYSHMEGSSSSESDRRLKKKSKKEKVKEKEVKEKKEPAKETDDKVKEKEDEELKQDEFTPKPASPPQRTLKTTESTIPLINDNWDSFDDDDGEGNDFDNPPPPVDYNYDDEDDIQIDMFEPQAAHTNDWEEVDPITHEGNSSNEEDQIQEQQQQLLLEKQQQQQQIYYYSDDEDEQVVDLPPLDDSFDESDEAGKPELQPVKLEAGNLEELDEEGVDDGGHENDEPAVVKSKLTKKEEKEREKARKKAEKQKNKSSSKDDQKEESALVW